MYSSEENQELIKDIKNPTRYYRIRLLGRGVEKTWGRMSEQDYLFWEKVKEDPTKYGFEDYEDDPFQTYMFDKEEYHEHIPEQHRIEYEWYDYDDIEHCYGTYYNAGYVEIIEVDGPDYNAKEVENVVSDTIENFCDDYQIENIWGDVPSLPNIFIEGTSEEKGCMFDGAFETRGKVDLSQLHFDVTETPNGDEIVVGVCIGDDYDTIDNDGGSTDGKALYIALVNTND
jgi:hypothetical protein